MALLKRVVCENPLFLATGVHELEAREAADVIVDNKFRFEAGQQAQF